jgi:hypothetical protein
MKTELKFQALFIHCRSKHGRIIVPVQNMKAFRLSRCTVPLIFIFHTAAFGGQIQSPAALSRGEFFRYILVGSFGEFPSRTGRFETDKGLF